MLSLLKRRHPVIAKSTSSGSTTKGQDLHLSCWRILKLSALYALLDYCVCVRVHNYIFMLYAYPCLPQAQALVRDSPLLTRLANSPLYPLIYLVQQFIHWLFMGYPLVPFCLFTYDKWLRVINSLECIISIRNVVISILQHIFYLLEVAKGSCQFVIPQTC